MLPFKLSDDICSLNPSVKRLTLTCEIDIDKLGEFKKISVYPSIIKSHQRCNYEEINSLRSLRNLRSRYRQCTEVRTR